MTTAAVSAQIARSTAFAAAMHANMRALDRDLTDPVDYHCATWAEMYVSGRWTLAELEAHCEAMLPVVSATGSAEAS